MAKPGYKPGLSKYESQMTGTNCVLEIKDEYILLAEHTEDCRDVHHRQSCQCHVTTICNMRDRAMREAVKSIKKQHLVEVRSMGNPPAMVKLALESVCLLLGENATDWKQIRTVIIRDNFITTIVNFDTNDLTDDIRLKMKQKYLDNPDFNFVNVNRASLACGPLVKWAIAQVNYAEMLNRVDPLRQELKNLERTANTNKLKGEEVNKLISQLEKSIAAYKEEYAMLISQAQAIKTDLANVQGK
ncbi:PREDICTED: dynein heavy chain, cytoplasmic-like, partial [Priapulus caudatus]|uniref:Dynein heavy chain, cytoplasmic-like n=1 Tax=Priapulus caudatus TaxID=37621 RepID=A0ABM1EL84_PRICU